MIDVEKVVKNVEKDFNMTEEEKEKFEPFAMALGNFMNSVWSSTDENKEKINKAPP